MQQQGDKGMDQAWDNAVINGYTGSFDEFMTHQYECYLHACRCQAKEPMSFDEWVELGE